MAESLAFKVNGVQLHAEQPSLLAKEILTLAHEKGAIPREPQDYILQGEKGQYSGDALVILADDNVLIAIPDTPTQVA